MSDEQAAAIPLGGLTAYRAVFTRGHCTADDVVLLPGIGGGVQTLALQFAKSTGARTIVTSSSDAKLERARALGADLTFNYKTNENWSKDVRAQSGGGPTLVIDASGGDSFARALDIARPGARIVTYGGTVGECPDSNVLGVLETPRHPGYVDGESAGFPRDARIVRERLVRPGDRRGRSARRRRPGRRTAARRGAIRESRPARERLSETGPKESAMAVKAVPDGFHTVNPYLIVNGVASVLTFLEAGLGAEILDRTEFEGRVMHATARIGDSRVMFGESPDPSWAKPANLYCYVEDCDAVYARAIAAGGESLMEPATMFYGDRHGGVKDPGGNQWWIATRVEDVAPDELARRHAAEMARRQTA